MTWEDLRMKSARNTSCSEVGLHSETAADGESPVGHRIRRALDGYATAIVRIIGESYGKESVQHAWREFTIGGDTPFLGDDPNAELFFSWLFHRWSPELEASLKIDDASCYGVPPTRAYLSRHGTGLDPLQRRYLEACLAARLGFYEILDCKPRIGFIARDVLAGKEVEVSESTASTSLQNGDIVFAHIVPIDGTAMMEAISPISFPSTLKTQLTELCRGREWGASADLPLRRLYFTLLESHRRPSLPQIRNIEDEVIEPRILYFDIESPQRAFDALAPLARGTTRQELLDMTKHSARGELCEATLPWIEPRDIRNTDAGAPLMGYLHIRGRKLIVEVNSKQRAKAFRLLIAGMPAATARYRRTSRQSPDKLLLSSSEATSHRATRH
jgi:hypothetical protein